jgi:hypothetical protein
MPPTGGYEPVQYRRNLPVRGFRPAYYLVAVAGICTYGFYRVGQGIREQKWALHLLCRGARTETKRTSRRKRLNQGGAYEDYKRWQIISLSASLRARRCGRASTLFLCSRPRKTAI